MRERPAPVPKEAAARLPSRSALSAEACRPARACWKVNDIWVLRQCEVQRIFLIAVSPTWLPLLRSSSGGPVVPRDTLLTWARV
jgi:hypothetical protein